MSGGGRAEVEARGEDGEGGDERSRRPRGQLRGSELSPLVAVGINRPCAVRGAGSVGPEGPSRCVSTYL